MSVKRASRVTIQRGKNASIKMSKGIAMGVMFHIFLSILMRLIWRLLLLYLGLWVCVLVLFAAGAVVKENQKRSRGRVNNHRKFSFRCPFLKIKTSRTWGRT